MGARSDEVMMQWCVISECKNRQSCFVWGNKHARQCIFTRLVSISSLVSVQ